MSSRSHTDQDRCSIGPSRVVRPAGPAEARAVLVEGLITLCARRPHHSRVLLEIGRNLCTTAIFGLHAGAVDDDRATWATLARLHATLDGVGFASRNRIDNFVAYLERYGFVEKRRSPVDRRLTLITPTQRLVEIDAAFLEVLEAAARRVGGAPVEAGTFTGRPGRHLAFRRETMRLLPRFREAAVRHREIVTFLERDSGGLVLLLLVQSAGGDDGLDGGLRYDTGADLASVSRTHVRMLIEDAERAGLLRVLEPGGRRIRLSPVLLERVDDWVADCLRFFEICEARVRSSDPGECGDAPACAGAPVDEVDAAARLGLRRLVVDRRLVDGRA